MRLTRYDRLSELGENWPPKLVMVSFGSSIPIGVTLFFVEILQTPRCQYCMPDLS